MLQVLDWSGLGIGPHSESTPTVSSQGWIGEFLSKGDSKMPKEEWMAYCAVCQEPTPMDRLKWVQGRLECSTCMDNWEAQLWTTRPYFQEEPQDG